MIGFRDFAAIFGILLLAYETGAHHWQQAIDERQGVTDQEGIQGPACVASCQLPIPAE